MAVWRRLLDLTLVSLLGQTRPGVDVHGSGGFTSLDTAALQRQLAGWVRDDHIPRVKMKIAGDWGADPQRDLDRIAAGRDAIGADAELFVDANGGYTRKQAVCLARQLADLGVTWFEDPVSSDTARTGLGLELADRAQRFEEPGHGR